MLADGYAVEESELGKIYYPAKGLSFEESAEIRRMEYPWLICMEVKGAVIHKEELL